MKNNICFILIIIAFLLSLGGCKNKDIESESFKIEQERAVPASSSVSISGSFSFSGTVKGMKVSVGEKENLNDADLHDMLIDGTDFFVTVENLKSSTEHYYRYSVDFGTGENYLTEVNTFTTLEPVPEAPKVRALEVVAIDDITRNVKCDVVSDGGLEVTERGICWNTSGNPSMDDEKIVCATGGTGQYTIRMEHLSVDRRYYVRAYAKNAKGTGLSEEVLEFEVMAPIGTTVSIILESNPEEGGTVGGEGFVDGEGHFDSGSQCTVNAVANTGYTFVNWTENDAPVSSTANYTFTVTASRTLVANFISTSCHITASVDPENSGTITGVGSYEHGDNCTLVATPNTGYEFKEWKENGTTVSTSAQYSFTVTESAHYVAHFQRKAYTIEIEASPGGTASGNGTYYYGDLCTVQASPVSGYRFSNWTEGDNVVSEEAIYVFEVSGNRNLKANFTKIQLAPTGAINGLFTINSNHEQVYFSQGNLQYIGSAATPYWKFADNQWDVLGNNGQGSSLSNVDRDLFGWGTSGFCHEYDSYNRNYQPWCISQETVHPTNNQYGYGPSLNNTLVSPNLTGSSRKSDWGINNPISNGGNAENTWRTLSGGNNGEWDYVLFKRDASTVNGVENARFAKAIVNNIHGLILFPDDYTHPNEVALPTGINDYGMTGWNENNYSVADFLSMEVAGAVFLPAAGSRDGIMVSGVGSAGNYWSTTHDNSSNSLELRFYNSALFADASFFRYLGHSVRLVCRKQ